MDILWTLPYLPWPTTSGGKLRQFHLLKALAQRGHRITLLVQSKTPLDDATQSTLKRYVHELIVLPRRPLRHPKTLWFALFGQQPLLSTINGYAPALEDVFERLLRQQSWDVIQIEHSYGIAPFLKALKKHQIPFFITEHNLESRLSTTTYNKLPSVLRPLAAWDQKRYERWEKKVLNQAHTLIAVTEDDAKSFRTFVNRPVHVVINGLDDEAFKDVTPNPSAQKILFVGNYEYAPNVDAIEWTCQDIMPKVWAMNPQAHLLVCGYALPERWRHQFTDPRIEWRGFVPDLAQVQSESSVFLAPLRDGGGSKLKVLEALAAGLPLISTPQGISGLTLTAGHDVLIGEDATTLAQHIADLLQSPDRARDIGRNGRSKVIEKHAWRTVAAGLEKIYQQSQHSQDAHEDRH